MMTDAAQDVIDSCEWPAGSEALIERLRRKIDNAIAAERNACCRVLKDKAFELEQTGDSVDEWCASIIEGLMDKIRARGDRP